MVNKKDITASYVSKEINRQPGVVCRTGGPTLLAAALRRPNRGWVKNFCREVQISNHGNPQRREPQVIPGPFEAEECLTNEPLILKNMITGGMLKYIGIFTPAGIRHAGCAPRTMTWRAVPALRLIPLVSQFLLGNANGWRSSASPGGAQCAVRTKYTAGAAVLHFLYFRS